MAYASLLDPKLQKKCSKFKDFNLDDEETSEIFLGAFIVFIVQVIVLYLILDNMMGEDFKIVPATSFKIIVPRFISSLMMHINVEPYIRNGLNLMKYATNHPYNFKYMDRKN